MRTFLFLAALLLPLSAFAEDKPWQLPELLDRMSEGKRRFMYDEPAAQLFAEQKVRLVNDAAETESIYPLGVELLKTAGLAVVAVEAGGTPTYRVVPAPDARKEPLKVYDAVAQLPAANEFCSLRIPLKFARGQNVLAILQDTLSDPRNAVLAQGNEDVLILTDYAQLLRNAGRLIQSLDVEPAKGASWRLTLAALEGTDDGDGSMPEAFRKASLPEATGRKTFRLLSDGCINVVTAGKSPTARMALAMGEKGTMDLQILASGADGGPVLDQVEARVKDGALAGAVLSARAALTEGEWLVVGTMPTKEAGARVVLVVKAEKVK